MKAMVLCAGYGTRLGELTREIPKPMLVLNGQPMLAYILANLKRHGFNQIAINLHFKPDLIRDYFGDGSKFGLDLTYSFEPQLLGTAGGLKKVENFFVNEEVFLVHYGDIITDQDFSSMLKFHLEKRALVTILIHQRIRSNSVVTLDDENRIIGFHERPSEESRSGTESPWVNSGICICSPAILNMIPSGVSCDLPRDVFAKLVKTKGLWGFPLSGFRCAVDSVERLSLAATALREGHLML